MKKRIKVIALIFSLLLIACKQSGLSDDLEYVSVKLKGDRELKIFKHNNFLELGLTCEHVYNLEDLKFYYPHIIDSVIKRKWDYEFISVELADCMDSSFKRSFEKLNVNTFGNENIKVKDEGIILTIELLNKDL